MKSGNTLFMKITRRNFDGLINPEFENMLTSGQFSNHLLGK